MDIFGYLTEVKELIFRKSASATVTIKPSTTAETSPTTFSLPDLTENTSPTITSDTLAGVDAKQTLQNKTLENPALNGAVLNAASVLKGTVSPGDDRTAAEIAGATAQVEGATDAATASTLVKRDASGDFSANQVTASLFIGDLQGNADTATTATSSGAFSGSLSGDVSGGQATTQVDQVGPTGDKKTATQIAASVDATEDATHLNNPDAIVKRDPTGNFAAGTITANLTGNVTGNASTATTATNFSGSLSGDVTGTQAATVVSSVGTKTAAQVASAVTTVAAATNLPTGNTLASRTSYGASSFEQAQLDGTQRMGFLRSDQAIQGDYSLDANVSPVIRIVAGTGITQLSTIYNPYGPGLIQPGQITCSYLILVNETGSDITVQNDQGGPASYGIYTGTGAAYTFKNQAAISLIYEPGFSTGRWVVAGGAGGGAGGTATNISEVTNVLAKGDLIYYTGTNYQKASAAAANTAEVLGIVSKVVTANTTYELTLSGLVTGITAANFTEASLPAPGTVVFLSAASGQEGKLTISEPGTLGQVSVPVGVYTGFGDLYFLPKRGAVVGGTNARTQLNLPSNTTTTIYTPPADITAGEITGWVYIDTSTTDYRFFLRAPFAKNGAGTNWNISPSYVGDTPPVGFSTSITNAGLVQITMPTYTGTAFVNYALNAPAVGATFPLAVDAGSLTTGTVAAARLPSFAPTQTKYTSGSGTYTVPAGVKWLKVRMVGGGGSGGATSATATNGNSGGNTTFGTSTANGGGGGIYGTLLEADNSGSGTVGAGLIGNVMVGGVGVGGTPNASLSNYSIGGMGGISLFGGNSGSGQAGQVGKPGKGYGAGGSGMGAQTTSQSGGQGGGAGGYVELIINSPASSYAYSVGAGGASVSSSGAGASGVIIIDEYYY